jgi:hypothetical protein
MFRSVAISSNSFIRKCIGRRRNTSICQTAQQPVITALTNRRRATTSSSSSSSSTTVTLNRGDAANQLQTHNENQRKSALFDGLDQPNNVAVDAQRTIYALSSAAGRAGISVIRISGPKANAALATLLLRTSGSSTEKRTTAALPEIRKASLRTLYDANGDMIDDALVVRFAAPHSFTGLDVVELSVHGSVAVVRDLLQTLSKIDGLSPAGAGEFTKQAFMNNKLDLTAVEGLADLVRADTTRQRQQALRQMKGALGQLYDAWRHDVLHALAHVEALIDFGDDERIDDSIMSRST